MNRGLLLQFVFLIGFVSLLLMHNDNIESDDAHTTPTKDKIKNNNSIRQEDWINNPICVFKYNTNKSSSDSYVRCLQCDKSMTYRGWKKHYKNKHNNSNSIDNSDAQIYYGVATPGGDWINVEYKRKKSCKKQKYTQTNTIFNAFNVNTTNEVVDNNIQNNINSNNICSDNININNINNINTSDVNNDNTNININDNDKIDIANTSANIIDGSDNKQVTLEEKSILKEDDRCEQTITDVMTKYENDGLRYTHITNNSYKFRCQTCLVSISNGKTYDLGTSHDVHIVKVQLQHHFVDKQRSKEHQRKAENPGWTDSYDRAIEAFTNHFQLLWDQIDLGLGDNSWEKRITSLWDAGAIVGNINLSHLHNNEKKKILYQVV